MFTRLAILVIILGVASPLQGQTIKKARRKIGGKSYSYYTMKPSLPSKGLVVLMPSRGETPKKLFLHTAIPRHLAQRGFTTIVPDLDYALILEDGTREILDDLIAADSAENRSNPNLSNVFIGGFSSGGAIAACYAEYRISEKGETSVGGLFLIDPPLDLARLYNAWTRLIDTPCPEAITSEAEFIKAYVERVVGGKPEQKRDNYLKLSAFAATDPSGGNARFLKNLPVRLYTEPDLGSMQTRYCSELRYENLNSSDLDALNECLTRLGNKKVEYIRTNGRGLHSWNIADPAALAEWMEKLAR